MTIAKSAKYGSGHKKLRKQAALMVDAGLVNCARCGKRIEPGQRWDLGHDDHNPMAYNGPEHRWCNRATAGRHDTRQSRDW